MMSKKTSTPVTRDDLDSALLKMQKQMLNEVAKADQRANDARKDAEQVRADCAEELRKMQSGINGLRTAYDKKIAEADKVCKQALGEIHYITTQLEDNVLDNAVSMLKEMEEKYKPLMDFVDGLTKK